MASYDLIARLLLITEKLRSVKYITKEELLSHVNKNIGSIAYDDIMERTLERDLRVLRNKPFVMDIIYVRNNGYHLAEKGYEGIEIEQVLEPFEILNALNVDIGIAKIVITEKYRNKGTRHLYPLIKAIRTNYKVSFNYGKYSSYESTKRVLAPYNIKQFKGQWYVIGKCDDSMEIKTFGLDRIENLNVLRGKFRKDVNVDISEQFKYSYGIYSGSEYPIEDIVLSFSKADGDYLKTVPLHSSQEILTDSDDEFVIKLRLRLTEDFVMAIVSRSWSLKVIQPESLRERVCNIYRDALTRNSD